MGEKRKQDEELCISWLNFNNLCVSVSVYVRSFVRSVGHSDVRTYARMHVCRMSHARGKFESVALV